jgi:hypothetical protein
MLKLLKYNEMGKIQGDQKVSVHLMITVQSSGAQRLFDHHVFYNLSWSVEQRLQESDM